jgi:hypothetical protein
MEDLYRALPKLLRMAGESEEVAAAAAFVAWRRIAGEQLLHCAVPFRLYRKTLVVAVIDSTWQKHLEPLRWNMLNRINAMFEQTLVTNIEFRVDANTVRAARAADDSSARDPAERDKAALASSGDLRAAAAAIRDDELRRQFLLAAGSCLNAKKE